MQLIPQKTVELPICELTQQVRPHSLLVVLTCAFLSLSWVVGEVHVFNEVARKAAFPLGFKLRDDYGYRLARLCFVMSLHSPTMRLFFIPFSYQEAFPRPRC